MAISIKYNAKLKLYYLNLHMAQNLGKIHNFNPVITTCKNDEKCNKKNVIKIKKSAYTKIALIYRIKGPQTWNFYHNFLSHI